MSCNNFSHCHAENMKLYAEDALKSAEPWQLWQNRKFGDNLYRDCVTHPQWFTEVEYRRKPITIKIGNDAIDLPLRTEPDIGANVYVVLLTADFLHCNIQWNGSEVQKSWLSRGLIHSTQVSAIKHANALLNLIPN